MGRIQILSDAWVEALKLFVTSRFYTCVMNLLIEYIDADEVVGGASDLG